MREFAALKKVILLSMEMAAASSGLLPGAGLAADSVSLSFQEKDGRFNIEGSFLVAADPKTVWDVLTDYDHIPQFVQNMKISKIQIREGNDVILHQEAEGGFLFFTQRITLHLHVQEVPLLSIHFQDMALKDFRSYKGSWQISKPEIGSQVMVIYALEGDRKFDAPGFLVNDAMSGGAKDLLRAVCREILLRQAKADKAKSGNIQLTRQTEAEPLSQTVK